LKHYYPSPIHKDLHFYVFRNGNFILTSISWNYPIPTMHEENKMN